MSGTAPTVVGVTPTGLLGSLVPSHAPTGLAGAAAAELSVGTAALPVSIGVAILRDRLYDIDQLVSRTVAYAMVTAVLAGLYFGLVALTTRVIDLGSALGVAASTLAAATLFTPLRRQVNRQVSRARYDADAILAAVTHRLRRTVEPETVTSDLLRTVADVVDPAHLSLWLRQAPAAGGRHLVAAPTAGTDP
ncbi:MAG TPA: hypothetical protein VMW47_02875 [Verrucomicrobiae bacterium]|nr:hypothetical protein [Verrucomicrobiae bacterium]